MILFLYIFILLLNLICVISNNKNKIVLLLSVIAMIVIMGGNNINSDFEAYKYFYERQTYPSSMEPGFVFVAKLFSQLGIEYQLFTTVVFSIGIIGLTLLAVKKTNIPHFVIIMYMLTMIFLDTVQIRQFIVYVLFAIALNELSLGRKKRYTIIILLGGLFQYTILVYLPLVLVDINKERSRRFIRSFVVTVFVLCVFVFVAGNRIPYIDIIMARFIDSSKIVYFTSRTRFGFLKYFVFQFVSMYLIAVEREYLIEYGMDEIKQYAKATYIAIMYTCVVMPLLMLNNNFYRFFRFGIIPISICTAEIIYDMKCVRKEKGEGRMIHVTNKLRGRYKEFVFLVFLFIICYGLLMQSTNVAKEVIYNNILLS